MAKKIRFPLSLPDGTQARSLDELQEHFDLEAVLGHYKSGKLLTWLRDRYNEEEADALESLDETAPDFQRRLCEVLGVEFTGSGADLEEIARRQERLAKLRQFTDEDEFIRGIDQVAFDQEELADLLDEGCGKIYLCGERFTVPASQRNKTYVGVNSPAVRISGTVGDDWAERDISFVGCQVDGVKKHIEQGPSASPGSSTINAVDPESVASSIYQQIRGKSYLETDSYILAEDITDIYALSKMDGSKTILLRKHEMSGMQSYDMENWPTANEIVFAFFKENKEELASEPCECCEYEDEEDGEDERLSVYQMNLKSKTAISSGFKVEPFTSSATDGKNLVLADDDGRVTHFDLEKRKKYPLRNKATTEGEHSLVCAKDAVYFVSEEGELIMYSFEQRSEYVICSIDAYGDCNAIAYFEQKIFLWRGDTIGCVDLDIPKGGETSVPMPGRRKAAKKSIGFEAIERGQEHCDDSAIITQDGGWIFVDNDDEEYNDCYTIRRFDFRTNSIDDIAPQCTTPPMGKPWSNPKFWGSLSVPKFWKINDWIYYYQGEDKLEVKVSLKQPMSVEILGSDL